MRDFICTEHLVIIARFSFSTTTYYIYIFLSSFPVIFSTPPHGLPECSSRIQPLLQPGGFHLIVGSLLTCFSKKDWEKKRWQQSVMLENCGGGDKGVAKARQSDGGSGLEAARSESEDRDKEESKHRPAARQKLLTLFLLVTPGALGLFWTTTLPQNPTTSSAHYHTLQPWIIDQNILSCRQMHWHNRLLL